MCVFATSSWGKWCHRFRVWRQVHSFGFSSHRISTEQRVFCWAYGVNVDALQLHYKHMVEWFWCVSVAYTGEVCALANNWFLLHMLVRIWTCAVESCVWASNAWTSTLKGVVWLWLVNDHLWGRVHGCAPMNESCKVDPVMKAVHYSSAIKKMRH